MSILPYRPVRGYGATLNGDAQLEDQELQDADLTQPGVLLRGPGASELPARVHESGGTETVLDPDGGQALFWRPDVAGDELCMVHEDTLYTSKPTEVTVDGTQAWRRVGMWAPWTLREVHLHQPLAILRDADVATIRDSATGKIYHVAVWEQPNTGTLGAAAAPGVYAIALDESGGVIAPATLLDAGTNAVNPRACACDTGVVIVWHDTATSMWVGSAWMFANPVEFVASVSIVTGQAGTAPLHDMRKDGANDRVIFVLTDSVGAFQIGIRRITPALVSSFVSAFAVVQAPSVGVSIDVDPVGGYFVAWADATTANAVHVDATGSPDTTIATYSTANPVIRITGCHDQTGFNPGNGTVAVEQRVGGASDYRNYVEVLLYQSPTLSSIREQRGAILWGHALVYRGRAVAWMEHYGPDLDRGVQLLTDLLSGDVLARAWSDRIGRGAEAKPTLYTQPSTPHVIGSTLYQAALLVFPEDDTAWRGQLGVTKTNGTPQPRQPATVPGYVVDAMAGYPAVFRNEAVEADWHALPAIASVATGGAGTGSLSAGTYVIAVTYKWLSSKNDVWRSAPVALARTGIVNTGSITATIVPCRWTAKGTVIVEVWRSLVNTGFPLYLERQYISDKTVDGQTALISNSDASALITGITLDQFEPAAILGHGRVGVTDYMVHVLGRFWSPDPGRPDIMRHTIERDISRDGFGWGWEDTQLVQLDTSARPVAAGDLEGNLAVFAGSECHLVYGLGPDKQGAGLFGQPSKFGVVDLETSQAKLARVPDSAVPGGLAYATPRGLYLLRRDRVSQSLSPQIDRLFRFDGVAPQALAYEPERGQLWLMTLTEEARSHRFSLLTGRWCADSARRAQDVAVSVGGVVAWLIPDASLRIQDASLLADGDDDLLFNGETPTLRLDPSNVGQPVTVQALLLHVYVLVAPAVLNVAIVDAKTSEVITLQQQVFTALGPQSRSTAFVNLPTSGHRVRWSQPAGDAGRIVVVEIDSQVEPSDGVLARTVTPL